MPTAKHFYHTSGTVEADLRKELSGMFHGGVQEVAKSHKAILRRMRRNTDGSLILAPSVDQLTNEPDLDVYDPFALGERYLWDEELINTRRVIGSSINIGLYNKVKFLQAGQVDPWTVIFFVEHSVNPTFYDRIVDLALDNEGNMIKPYRRKRIYRPQSVIDYRSDNGRIEFWGIFCSEKDSVLIEDDFTKK